MYVLYVRDYTNCCKWHSFVCVGATKFAASWLQSSWILKKKPIKYLYIFSLIVFKYRLLWPIKLYSLLLNYPVHTCSYLSINILCFFFLDIIKFESHMIIVFVLFEIHLGKTNQLVGNLSPLKSLSRK